MILVVRHAVAGEKAKWKGRPDAERPLSGRGRKQAKALVKQHRDRDVERIVSSPLVRCLETVQPLADDRGIEVEVDDRLRPDASFEQVAELLRELVDEDAVVCSHGEVIGELVTRFVELGLKPAKRHDWKKGSTWVLRTKQGRFTKASYLEPRR